MFGKACKRIAARYIFFSLISLLFLFLTLPAQEKEDTQDPVVTGAPRNGSGINAGYYPVSVYIETLEKAISL